MAKKWFGWLLLVAVTFCNLRLFLSRWAEEPRAPFEPLVSDAELASLAIGAGALVLAFALLDILRSLRIVALVLLLAACTGVVFAMPSLGVYKFLEYPVTSFVVAGAVAALVCCQLRDSSPDSGELKLGRSFVLMTLASLNAFLLMAPWTTHVPSYMQDTLKFGSVTPGFYYGSVHSDISPVSIGLRWIINQFFAQPSINATALSSMIYVAVGLGMAGVAVEMVFGRLWGWALIFLACTDRWLFASAISSAIIGQPVLSTASVLLLCAWTLCRKQVPLSWKEAAFLGAANALGLLYTLFSYSAARMTWLVGSGIAALILIARRAVWFNVNGFGKVAVALLPSVALVASIWVFFFNMDNEQFAGQLLTSPKKENQIQDINSYRVKLIPLNDPDMPIWWGTGQPVDGTNISLYWKRTPQEVYEKAKWFMTQVSTATPIPFVLVLLGGIGMAVGLASDVPLRRWFSVCLIVLTIVSFSTYVLAQDASAYRRALATNLLVITGVVMLFAAKSRGRLSKWLAIGLCGILAFLKAPKEINALFDEGFWSPVCVTCQPFMTVRKLVNDPAFAGMERQPLRYLIRGPQLSPLYTRCASMTFESNEFKTLAPKSSELDLKGKTISQAFAEFQTGDILMATCPPSAISDPDLAGVCQGSPLFGKPVAIIPSKGEDRVKGWWAFVEKQ